MKIFLPFYAFDTARRYLMLKLEIFPFKQRRRSEGKLKWIFPYLVTEEKTKGIFTRARKKRLQVYFWEELRSDVM
jgi:hypothetical protein